MKLIHLRKFPVFPTQKLSNWNILREAGDGRQELAKTNQRGGIQSSASIRVLVPFRALPNP
jgi:hypothetical protein